jgi:hypothetical protein
VARLKRADAIVVFCLEGATEGCAGVDYNIMNGSESGSKYATPSTVYSKDVFGSFMKSIDSTNSVNSRSSYKILNDSKLFEKIEIQWFSIPAMKSRIHEFRSFYQDIVRELIRHENHIRRFLRKAIRKTKRVYPGGKKTKKHKNYTIKNR